MEKNAEKYEKKQKQIRCVCFCDHFSLHAFISTLFINNELRCEIENKSEKWCPRKLIENDKTKKKMAKK